MGTWSGAPFGNDTASDFSYDLDDHNDWTFVEETLNEVLSSGEDLDSDVAAVGIAGAEVVAHGLGRPTQSDAYTESVESFAKRAGTPPAHVVRTAEQALALAISPDSELTELWEEGDPQEWNDATARLIRALKDDSPGA